MLFYFHSTKRLMFHNGILSLEKNHPKMKQQYRFEHLRFCPLYHDKDFLNLHIRLTKTSTSNFYYFNDTKQFD
jgi:hypothetical protein